jgi:beta-N-acetylhexosaminidase
LLGEIADIFFRMRKFLAVALVFALLGSALADTPTKNNEKNGSLRPDKDGERWAQKMLKKMTLEEKVGQMFMVWARVQFMNVNSPEYLKLKDQVQRYHLGGLGVSVPVEGAMLAKSEPLEAAALINELQRESKLPLIFAADFERGLPMRFNGATGFPHAMAFGAAGNRDFAYQFGKITGEEARAIGVQWNWFPDADVNSNPNNPIINTRSFGEDPKQVSEMVTAYIEGAHAAKMLTTVKHFPGHGDTDTDTHLALARVNQPGDRLQNVEFVPFRAGIAAGVDSVMVAHVTVPAVEPDPNRPASISAKVITDLLRRQMGFQGLVVTDALDMAGLTKIFASFAPPPPSAGPVTRNYGTVVTPEASARESIEALMAGNDILILPPDLGASIQGIVTAVKNHTIPESRINESVLKILCFKAAVGLNKNKLVDLNSITKQVAKPESLEVAQAVADASVTLVKSNGQVLPIKGFGTSLTAPTYQPQTPVGTVPAPAHIDRVLMVVFTDDIRTEGARILDRQLRMRTNNASIVYIDENVAAAMSNTVLDMVAQAEKVIAIADVIPSAGRRVPGNASGSVALPPASDQLLGKLLTTAGAKTVLVSTGNPYVAASYPTVQNYMCTYSDVPVSDTALVKALFGEISIQGHLPVTIPGVAERGQGIMLGATTKPWMPPTAGH